MFPYVTLAKDKSWVPGPYEGVELLVLHKNEATGGVTILRKFREGLTVPPHSTPASLASAAICPSRSFDELSLERSQNQTSW